MSVRGYSEYSEDELEVVRLIGADGLIVWPNSRLKLGRSHARAMKWVLALGLATQDNRDATRYDLTRKGRKLLRQMERDEKRAAQHRDEHKFRAQISGHEVFKSAEIVLRSTDGTLFSDRTFLSREYNVVLTSIEPEPLCPVCGKPAGEHRDGLFCCGHCKGEAMLWAPVTAHMGWTAHCNNCKIRTMEHDSAENARAAWNRRA